MQLEKVEQMYENLQEDEHVLHMWAPLSLEIDEQYEYVKNGWGFELFSNALYLIAIPILFVLNKIVFGFEVEGRENIEKVEGGKITVSNHVHPMDCTMNALINLPEKTYFPTLKANFEIPVVRHLIRLLNAVPIPNEMSNKKEFLKTMQGLLKEGKTIHLYPEVSLWPYYEKVRKFKKGAFILAIENNVPIVPIVYLFEKPQGIYEIFKSKPVIKAKVLEPIYPDHSLEKKEAIEKLKDQVHGAMEDEIEKAKIKKQA